MPGIQYQVRPSVIPVDQLTEVEVSMVLDRALEKGASVAFALPVVWNCQRYCVTYTKEPQIVDPEAPDYVVIESPEAEITMSTEPVMMPAGAKKGHIRKIIGTISRGSLKPGDCLTLRLHGFRAPWLAENGEVRIWIDDEELGDTPRLRTIPTEAKRLRMVVPSCSRPGEPFRARIVSLDSFWNLSSSSFRSGVLSVDGGGVIEEGIGFTGAYEVLVTIDEPGVHRLHFAADPIRDTLLENEALSNPVRISNDPTGPFWGDLHGHDKMHNCGAGEHALDYARRVSCLDFVCVAPDFKGFPGDDWQVHVDRVDAGNEPGRFTTILGHETGYERGHHNVYYRRTDGAIVDSSDPEQRTIDKLLTRLEEGNHFVVPHHVGVDWRPQEGYFPERDPWIPLIEIYSQHGCGEMYAPEHILAYEFNRTRGKEQKYASSVDSPVYARDAWAQGRRYGVVASSDGHMGQPGKPIKGVAAAFAAENSRDVLFDALRSRQTYATTGERILIDFRINGAGMGSEITSGKGEALDIEIEINGTDQIAFVEVARLRFNEGEWTSALYERIVEKNLFQEGKIVREYDYTTRFEETFEGDVMYYLRMAQRRTIDDYPVFAWSSPIWVTQEA